MDAVARAELSRPLLPPRSLAPDGLPYASVEQGLSAIDSRGPEALSSDTLREDLRWFAAQQRALEAMAARWLGELDRRVQDRAEPDPIGPLAEWLHRTLCVTPNAAYAQIRAARALEHLPRTTAAWRLGELSSQHVSVICRAKEQLHETRLNGPEMESELVSASRYMDPRELHNHFVQLRYQADQEAGLAAEEQRRRRCFLHLREKWSGSFVIEGQLDPEGGSALHTVLTSLMGRRQPDDDRGPAERRAAALGQLAKDRLDAGDLPERGGEKPHLMLVAELSTLRLEKGSRLAELDWGPLVTGETARRIGCDAAVTPVLVGPEGEILHVGRRTRTVPASTRRALNLRDRRCQWQGCTVPASQCSPHHKVHWADGGSTQASNLQLYCTLHHRLKHPENARFRRGP